NAADATITEAVFYPDSEKGKGNALPAKKGIARKKKTDDPRPLAGVRIKKDRRPVTAKKRSNRSKTK
ncbi:MAG: hypothetical protein Q4F84_07225, partial [Fibrobacter sp.]|nr:hypothetical protein [Fibrobacter sp.]